MEVALRCMLFYTVDMVYTNDTVDTVDTVYTVYTIKTALCAQKVAGMTGH